MSFSFGGEGILQQHGHKVTRLLSVGAITMIKYTTEEMRIVADVHADTVSSRVG